MRCDPGFHAPNTFSAEPADVELLRGESLRRPVPRCQGTLRHSVPESFLKVKSVFADDSQQPDASWPKPSSDDEIDQQHQPDSERAPHQVFRPMHRVSLEAVRCTYKRRRLPGI